MNENEQDQTTPTFNAPASGGPPMESAPQPPAATPPESAQTQPNLSTATPLPQPAIASSQTSAASEKSLNKSEKLKRSFFQVLIGCLLGAAAIAVIAVLAGSFNETLGRALGTIAMVALHALLGFSYISETEKRDKQDGGRGLELFSGTAFVLIVLSFVTSIFAIWQLLSGDLTLRLYMLYGVLLFATLHADVLYRLRRFEAKIDNVVTINYFFMAVVVAMLAIVIFSSDPSVLGDFYYRLLAALGIIDATLTITAIILHKLYLQKHPELTPSSEPSAGARTKNFWKNPFVVLVLIYLTFQVIGAFAAMIIGI